MDEEQTFVAVGTAETIAAQDDSARTRAVISQIVGGLAPEPVDEVLPDQTLINELGYYSMRLIELSFAVEELFEMEPMALDDLPPIGVVRELQDFMVEKVAEGLATAPDPAAVAQYLDEV
jgi:acyl carrier protein